jgi:Proline racemase
MLCLCDKAMIDHLWTGLLQECTIIWKRRLKIKEQFVHESYIGSKFTGQVERESKVGEFNAIVPSVEGWAKVYGYNKILIDDEDPYAHGFQVI